MCQGGKPVVIYGVVYRSSTALAASTPSSRFDGKSSKALIQCDDTYTVPRLIPLLCESHTSCLFILRSAVLFFSSFSSSSFMLPLQSPVLCPCCVSENVQVKYRSKVVKYTWPMPHQAAESVPWVQVTLANGETIQTKLLVSLIPSRKLQLFICCCCYFTVLICFSDWCRWTKLNGEAEFGDTHSQVEL